MDEVIDENGSRHSREIVWNLGEREEHSVEVKVLKSSPSCEIEEKFETLKGALLSSCPLVFDHLRANPVIGHIVAELALFVKSELEESNKPERTLTLLHAVHSLVSNEYALPDDYLDVLIEAVLFCLVDPMMGYNDTSYCFLIKDIAADVLSELLLKDVSSTTELWGAAFSKLKDCFEDSDNPFVVHYGAVAASLSMGRKAVEEIVLPSLATYCRGMLDGGSLFRNVPPGRSALRVWSKLLLVFEEWTRSNEFLDRGGTSHVPLSEYPLISARSSGSREFNFRAVPESFCSPSDFFFKRIQARDLERNNECKKKLLTRPRRCLDKWAAVVEEVEETPAVSLMMETDGDVPPEKKPDPPLVVVEGADHDETLVLDCVVSLAESEASPPAVVSTETLSSNKITLSSETLSGAEEDYYENVTKYLVSYPLMCDLNVDFWTSSLENFHYP